MFLLTSFLLYVIRQWGRQKVGSKMTKLKKKKKKHARINGFQQEFCHSVLEYLWLIIGHLLVFKSSWNEVFLYMN